MLKAASYFKKLNLFIENVGAIQWVIIEENEENQSN